MPRPIVEPIKAPFTEKLLSEISRVNQSRFLGMGMRRSTFQFKKGFFGEKGGGNSFFNEGFGFFFTVSAIQ